MLHSIEEFMSDKTQRLCTNQIVKFRSFLVYILYGFLWTEGANSWGAGFGVLHATELTDMQHIYFIL